ncbi:hypothetical protein CVT24_002973 [Panaeolus cyanescens]|uniref:F-box domain-containing protein n=1 Tax=Panaeolus cyanescens TaxID=181874 RepID=A0A409VTZ7_9AGAR|nr:hypothetical protein CVT24_002973 [Panaeolus cyanescens]
MGHAHLVALANFTLLQGLHLHALSLQFLDSFGTGTTNPNDSSTSSSTVTSPLYFPSLTSLSITTKFNHALALLSNASFPSLHRLTHTFHIPTDETHYLRFSTFYLDWVAFFTALKRATRTSPTFTNLYLCAQKDIRVNRALAYGAFIDAYPGVEFDTLFPSLSQFEFTVFAAEFPLFHNLTLDNVEAITQRWPGLNILYLHSSSTYTECLGLSVLDIIARNLPHLHTLRVDINPGPTESLPWHQSKGLTSIHWQHPLKHLIVRFPFRSQPEGLEAVGGMLMFVDAVFPGLERFEEVEIWSTHLYDCEELESKRERGGGGFMTVLKCFKDARRIERCLEENQKACYALALTCRVFRKPAQDVLWRCVDCGVFPLFKLLSNFMRREPVLGPKEVFFLNGSISPSELEHLKSFALRVRALNFEHQNPDCVIEPSTYALLVHALQGKPVFPNLQRLSVSLNQNESSSILQLLYSPRLKEIDLINLSSDLYARSSDALAYLQIQSTYQPHLSSLVITFPCTSDLLNLALSSFPHLNVLQLNIRSDVSVTFMHIVALSKLAALCQLDLQITGKSSFDFSAANKGSTVCFKHLQHLSVCSAFNNILLLLSHISCPALYSFTHVFTTTPERHTTYPALDWPSLFDAIQITAPNLKELYSAPSHSGNSYEYDDFINTYPGVSLSDIADSLFSLNLVALGFEFPLFNSFTLGDLECIFESWPNITFLHIHGTQTNINASPVLDISALERIALELPYLNDLSIDLDVGALRTLDALPQWYTHSLVNLSLKLVNWTDDLANCAQLVTYVDALFPHLVQLQEFEFVTDKMGLSHKAATSMYPFLRQLQLARCYERERQGFMHLNIRSPSMVSNDDGCRVRRMPMKLYAGGRILRAS